MGWLEQFNRPATHWLCRLFGHKIDLYRKIYGPGDSECLRCQAWHPYGELRTQPWWTYDWIRRFEDRYLIAYRFRKYFRRCHDCGQRFNKHTDDCIPF